MLLGLGVLASKAYPGANLATTLCALLLLSACGPSNNEPPAPKLFKEQRDVLDKAKAVEPAQQQQDDAQRKASEY
jgi:hypothetical protein